MDEMWDARCRPARSPGVGADAFQADSSAVHGCIFPLSSPD